MDWQITVSGDVRAVALSETGENFVVAYEREEYSMILQPDSEQHIARCFQKKKHARISGGVVVLARVK